MTYEFIKKLKKELNSIPNRTVVRVIKSSDEKKKKLLFSRRSYPGSTR